MASIIPGYEYDIFISYRQKDNKYDGWVTEFVNNLKKELEATFKEDLSIYTDDNSLDGLLEIHNVDKSLEGKLKCTDFYSDYLTNLLRPKKLCLDTRVLRFQQTGKGRSVWPVTLSLETGM